MSHYNHEQEQYDTINDAIQDSLVGLSEADIDSIYSDTIDDAYGEIDCGFSSYQASYLMKEMDETMYRCGLSDYISEYYREINNLYYNEDEAQAIEDECEFIED